MDWQKCMNQAIDYIENNLSDEIDYSVAAQAVFIYGTSTIVRIYTAEALNNCGP